jgi:hypothetical protein
MFFCVARRTEIDAKILFPEPESFSLRSLGMTPARGLLLAEMVMKVLREYSRLVLVYASFAAFLAAEAAVIFIVYRHMGIM